VSGKSTGPGASGGIGGFTEGGVPNRDRGISGDEGCLLASFEVLELGLGALDTD